jgi:hypothetical protein
MKLTEKAEKPATKTTVWVVERTAHQKDKRKLFTCYGITAKKIEKILLQNFKEKK